MSEYSSIPESWISDPPETLVIGDGPYARALTLILGGTSIPSENLLYGIEEPQEGGLPQVLGSLQKVVFVASTSQSGADLLRWHRVLWSWIEKLSPEGEQHEVAILFVLPDSSSASLEESLALGLGLKKFDPASGHEVARMGDRLESLLAAWAMICPTDLPALRARQASDAARAALRKLQCPGGAAVNREAAREVLAIFAGREYQLDVFCRPPSHRHGNLLRGWLRSVVTDGVTPDSYKEGCRPSDWLVDFDEKR